MAMNVLRVSAVNECECTQYGCQKYKCLVTDGKEHYWTL